jgi:hypothetical protein
MVKNMRAYREIAENLYYTYYNYYCYVFFDFIVEAVENTIKDFLGEIKSLKEIHQHIKENYI